MSDIRPEDYAFVFITGLVVGTSFLAAYLAPDRNVLTRALTRFVKASGFRLLQPRTQCLIWAVGSFLLAAMFIVVFIVKGSRMRY